MSKVNPITKIVLAFSQRARAKRAFVFRNSFLITEDTKVLDLGSESGANINSVLQGTSIKPENVYIADIDDSLIQKGADKFGFVPVLIDETGRVPFDDYFFDIVYCSSVIEHVTVPKDQVWLMYSDSEFRDKSLRRQKEFASEIQRLGRQYFVQTPYVHFPVESHTWLPFIAWLPRRLLIPLLKATNLFWVKSTTPDWYLLNRKEMSSLFMEASIVSEKTVGLTKSIMAIKSTP
jgi:SAM-dependent methyltransferase